MACKLCELIYHVEREGIIAYEFISHSFIPSNMIVLKPYATHRLLFLVDLAPKLVLKIENQSSRGHTRLIDNKRVRGSSVSMDG